MDELAIKIEHVSKQYRLGAIGGGTLRGDLQTWWARKRGKEDPNSKIGARTDVKIGERFLALDDINLEVKKGEALGIIGHNGAGKSTLLKLLSRVTAPTTGKISYNGRITSMLEVGTGFHPELTGRENIYMNGAILGLTRKEIDAKMEQIIDFSEVRQFIDTPVKRYSSGMYVKLAFSVAAHLDSEIMIMDEVLAVGDMAYQKKCLSKMREAADKEGRTVLYVSHNMNTIRQLCDRCIVLDHGRIIFSGDVEEAIDVYMDAGRNENLRIDYVNYKRPLWLQDKRVRFLSAEYVGKSNISFDNREKMIIHMQWENRTAVKNAGLRLEVWTLDEVPQATYVLYNTFSGEKNQITDVSIELDISQLMQSKYKFFFTLFDKDQFGNSRDIDCVPGLSFDILPVMMENESELLWRPKNWGYVRMASSTVNIKQADK